MSTRDTSAPRAPWAIVIALAAIAAAAKADPGEHESLDVLPPLSATIAPLPDSAAPDSAAPVITAPNSAASEGAAPASLEPLVEPMPDAPGATPPIEHPEALASFFRSLERTRAGEGITRVTNLGDSSIGMDALPHGLRRRYQAELGDAGPGFVLLQGATRGYLNRTVRLRVRTHWIVCTIVHRCLRDGRYGLGGVSAESRGFASTRIRPRAGREVSRAEIWYLAQPGGGRLEVRFGDREEVIDTSAPAPEDRWAVIERERGEHELRVTARGGPVRAYGVVLENDGPGVVWDSLSVRGALTRRLLEQDASHFAAQLARRDPDLVVLNYGGNDLARLVRGDIDGEGLAEETRTVLARVRSAAPRASCLVVGIGDHRRSGAGVSVRPRDVEEVLRAQRDAAADEGCAFWDTTAAMGGTRTYARWRRSGLATADGRHLAERGRHVIAARLYAALEHARAVSPP